MFTSLFNWLGSSLGKNSYSHLNLPSEYDVAPNENFEPGKDYYQEGMPEGELIKGGPVKDDAYWDEKYALSNYWFGNKENRTNEYLALLLIGGYLFFKG